MSLASILKRSHNGLPSLVTTIDRQIYADEPVYSARAVSAALANLVTAEKTGNKFKIRVAFKALQRAVEAPRSRKDNYVHVSELQYGCRRMFFYRITDAPVTNEKWKPDAKLQRTFDVGTWYHEYIQYYLLQSGVLHQDEVRVENKDLNLLGHDDGEGQLEEMPFILEIKTINSYGYAAVLKANKPKEEHLYQAGVYSKERKIKTVIFLYINKDNSEMKEFVCNQKDFAPYQKEAYEKLDEINAAVDSGVPPKRICKSATDENALKCSYCNHCFGLK